MLAVEKLQVYFLEGITQHIKTTQIYVYVWADLALLHSLQTLLTHKQANKTMKRPTRKQPTRKLEISKGGRN